MTRQVNNFQFALTQIKHISFPDKPHGAGVFLNIVIDDAFGRVHPAPVKGRVAGDMVPVGMGVEQLQGQISYGFCQFPGIGGHHTGINQKGLDFAGQQKEPHTFFFKPPCLFIDFDDICHV